MKTIYLEVEVPANVVESTIAVTGLSQGIHIRVLKHTEIHLPTEDKIPELMKKEFHQDYSYKMVQGANWLLSKIKRP